MINVDLIRLETEYGTGTFGALLVSGRVFCATLEPPDFGNRPNVSCIPASQYVCDRIQSPTFGETFEVVNVPGRSSILFHKGNVVAHTEGCIILGQYWNKLKGERAVLNSGKTFDQFMWIMAGTDQFKLSIFNAMWG